MTRPSPESPEAYRKVHPSVPSPVADTGDQIARFAAALFDPGDPLETRAIWPDRQRGARSIWVRTADLAIPRSLKWMRARDAEGAGANPRTGEGGRNAGSVALARSFVVDFDGGTAPEEALARGGRRVRLRHRGLPAACARHAGASRQRHGPRAPRRAQPGDAPVHRPRRRQPNMGVWLKAYSGDPESVRRRGRAPEHLNRPTLSVALTVQPESVRGMFASRAARGRGLLARFLTSAPASRVGRRKTGGAAQPVPEHLHTRYLLLVKRLLRMPIPEDRPLVVEFSPEATALFNEFESRLEPELARGGLLGTGPTGAASPAARWPASPWRCT